MWCFSPLWAKTMKDNAPPMASFHLSVQVVKRSAGRSVVAMAAYRSGQTLRDERNEVTRDYSKRRGVAHEEVMAPEDAAPFLKDREKLWNHAETLEKREDAQLAREVNLALPHELSAEDRLALVRQFVQEEFVSLGMVADVAVHEPVPPKGDDPRNHHAHVLLTLRKATPEGLAAKKSREWNSNELLRAWRQRWAALQNVFLARGGHRTQVDHRSLKAQREEAVRNGDRRLAALLDRQPEIHVGVRARAASRRGHKLVSKERKVGIRQQPSENSPIRIPAPDFATRPEWVFSSSGKVPKRRPAHVAGDRIVRSVDYRQFDKGTRVDWLTNLMLGNNERAKAKIAKLDRQTARLRRRLDYWEKGFLWKTEGAIKGRAFRYHRAKTAEEEKARRLHGEKRKRQVRELIKQLEGVLIALRGGREDVLSRRKAVGRWHERVVREMDRSREWDGRLR
jgi:hypothetical protein